MHLREYGLGFLLIRLLNEMSQKEAAHWIGVTPSHLCKVEQGVITVPPSILRGYAQKLEVSTSQLKRFCEKVADLEEFQTLDVIQKQKMRVQHYIDIIQNGEKAA